MITPYADAIAKSLVDLNQKLAQVFQLRTPYTRDDVLPGHRYGFIDVRSLDEGENRGTVAGVEIKNLTLEVLLTIGCENFGDAIVQTGRIALELDAGIPAMKQLLEAGSFHDFKLSGSIQTSKRQLMKPIRPGVHSYVVDATCEVIAPIAIYKDINGEHVVMPTTKEKSNVRSRNL